jgi:hypothetical protein
MKIPYPFPADLKAPIRGVGFKNAATLQIPSYDDLVKNDRLVIGPTDFILHSDFTVYFTATRDDLADWHSVTAPMGLVTDFASVPKLFWSLIGPIGTHSKAAIVHDFMYLCLGPPGAREYRARRSFADRLFYAMMIGMGTPAGKAQIIFQTVRTFGRSRWPTNPEVRFIDPDDLRFIHPNKMKADT